MPVSNADVSRLVPNPSTLGQLRLERTQIDATIASWLGKATNLRELDLSSTRIDDKSIESLASPNLEVLWLTGSTISDGSIDAISKMNTLQSVDLQKTKVTPAGIKRLRAARPQLEINPLQVN
jgi:Leucine-rich repeat (LRR) protein